MGCDPARSMGFETVGEFNEELLMDIGCNVSIKENVFVHKDVLEVVEERWLGDNLHGGMVQVGVDGAGTSGSWFASKGISPCISMAEGIVWRWGGGC